MNPIKYAQMIKYLTRVKKEKPDLPDVFPASEAPIPPVREDVETMNAINAFIRRERQQKAGGGMLVQPSADGSRPGYNGANKTSNFTVEQQKNIKAWEDATGKKFSDLLKLKGRSAASKRSEIKRGKTKGTGIYTKGGEKLSLPKNMQSLYNQIKDEKYGGKKFSELSGSQRSNFKNNFKTTQAAYNRTKNAITLEELQKLLTNEFGQDISKNKIRGRFGKTGITDFAKEIEKLKVGTGLGGAEVYYKKPSKLDLKNISQYLEFAGKNRLNKNTVDTMLKLHEKFNYLYRQNALPSMEDVIASDPFFKNLSHNRIGNATARLSQIYSGHKFKNPEFNNIRINKKAGEKMFDLMSKARFGNPYYAGFYRTALQTIDEKLGNKKGTFESLKKEAVKILKKNKIPVYNINAKNPVGFNINEIAGVAGSSKSKAAEFSQFVDIMEGSLNQQEMASFQSELSRARKAIEDDPSKLSVESKKINSRAKSLEKTYNVELPRLRDPDATKYFSPTRLRELNAQGLDIVKAAERAGYTIQMPKGAVTAQEFVSNKKVQANFLKKMGFKCKFAASKGGLGRCDDPDSYTDDINKTRQDLKSDDVRVRAAAQAKLNKGLQVAKTLPTIGKFLRRAGQATVGAVSSTLKTLGLTTPVGYAIEGIVEGGIYDYFKKQGYTDQQALAETFTPGLVSGRPEGVPWYGGAESLLEKELIGDPQQNPKVAQYVSALKDQDQVYDAFGRLEQGQQASRKDIIEKAQADIRDLSKTGTISNIDKIMNPESMASRAYQTAVERQKGAQDQRAKDYMAENYVQQEPSEFMENQLQKERNEAMLQMFPSPTPELIQQMYPEQSKLLTAEGYKNVMKSLDDFQKQSYFADNFRLEKAGGGIAKLAGVDSGPPPASGPNSQGLQGLMKRVRNF